MYTRQKKIYCTERLTSFKCVLGNSATLQLYSLYRLSDTSNTWRQIILKEVAMWCETASKESWLHITLHLVTSNIETTVGFFGKEKRMPV